MYIYVHYVRDLGSEACLEGLFTPYSSSHLGSCAGREEGPVVCTGVGGYREEEGGAEGADALRQGIALGWTWRTG